MKGAGYLHLFKNRELAYQEKSTDFNDLTNQELNKFRSIERDDVSYIDTASAVLSRGGGATFSVKSGVLSSLSIKSKNPFDKKSSSVS